MQDPKKHMALMKRLFSKFDVDCGGEIDGREMRALMVRMHPTVPRGAISNAMQEVVKYTGTAAWSKSPRPAIGPHAMRPGTSHLRSPAEAQLPARIAPLGPKGAPSHPWMP